MSADNVLVEDPECTSVDVLLVDDDEGVHFLVARRLRRHDITLAWCADGASAREYLRGHSTSLLLLDQRLPDCQGDELLAQLGCEGLLGSAHVSICTAHPPTPEICARIVDLGANVRPKSDILSRDGVSNMLATLRA